MKILTVRTDSTKSLKDNELALGDAQGGYNIIEPETAKPMTVQEAFAILGENFLLITP